MDEIAAANQIEALKIRRTQMIRIDDWQEADRIETQLVRAGLRFFRETGRLYERRIARKR